MTITYKPWNKKELADVIEATRKSSTYQGIGAHPVCLADNYWTTIIETLRKAHEDETKN